MSACPLRDILYGGWMDGWLVGWSVGWMEPMEASIPLTVVTSRARLIQRNLNLYGIFLHLLGDALSTIGAMISGVLM